MSPEQAVGQTRAIGRATDVYAPGALLYEGLTGQVPFRGTTTYETLRMGLSQEPTRPGVLVRGLSRHLETVSPCCLQKNAPQPYQPPPHQPTTLNPLPHD